MSVDIDQRIVEMKFDNKNFEKNISTSMSSLQKFKESLNFSGATKGIKELNKETSNFSLGKMEEAAQSVEVKFNAMSIVAISAINRIVSTATDAGIKLVKSLSVDNIAAGWQKFSEKTTSVGTLVAQGYDMSVVENQLRRLNWFTDETSYNFTDMVSNIAKFTASGKDLKESVTALEGIANWAALSGQNAQTASRAMYQLSQAMGAGYMRKEDWKSIQNVSMDTSEFRQKALEAGVAVGTLKDNLDGTYQSLTRNTEAFTKSQFSEHLTEDAWFTSDVMMKVYTDYSKAVDQIFAYSQKHGITASEAIEELSGQIDEFSLKAFKAAQEARTWADVIDSVKDAVSTGWMTTFETLFGNYEEAKRLFTDLANELYDVFAEGGNTRNALLTEGLGTGWNILLKQGIDDGAEFKELVISLGKETGVLDEEMEAMVRADFAGSLKEGWINAEILSKALTQTTEKLHRYSEEELLAQGMTKSEIDALRGLEDAMFDGTLSVQKFLDLIQRTSGRENLVQAFWNIWNALFAIDEETEKAVGIISVFKEALSKVFPPITAEKIYNITVRIRELTEGLILSESQADGLRNIFTALLKPFKLVGSALKTVFKWVGKFVGYLGNLAGSFLELFANASPLEVILEKLFGDEKKIAIIKAFQNAIDNIKSGFSAIKEKATGVWEKFRQNENVNTVLVKIGDALGVIAGWLGDRIIDALDYISKINFGSLFENIGEKAINGISLLAGGFNTIKETVKGMDWSSISKWGSNIKQIFTNFASWISSITNWFNNPETLFGKFVTRLKNFGGVFGDVFGSIKDSLVAFLKELTPAKALVFAFGLSLITLFANVSKLANGIGGLATSLTAIVDTLKKKIIKANPILQFAFAVGVLTTALIILSNIPADQLKSAAWALGGILAATLVIGGIMVALSKKLSNPAVAMGMELFAQAIRKIATSILILSAALWIVSKVDTENIVAQLGALSAILLGFGILAKALAKLGPELAEAGLGFIVLAGAILILTLSLKRLEQIDPASMLKAITGLIPIFAAFILLGTAARIATTKGAIGLTLMSGNILLMVKILERLEDIDAVRVLSVLPTLTLIVMSLILMSTAVAAGAGQNSAKAGIAMLALTGSIYIIISVIERLATLNSDDIKKGLIVVGSLMLLFAAVTAATHFAGTNAGKVGKTFLLMAAAITFMVLPIHLLGQMTDDEVKRGGIVVGGIMAIFAGVLACAGLAKKATGAIIAMSVMIGILSAALVLLTIPNSEEIMVAAKALSMVMASLALTFAAMGLIVKQGNTLTQFVNIGNAILMAGALLAMVVIAFQSIKIPENITGEQFAGFGVAVAAMVSGLAVAVAALNKIKAQDFNSAITVLFEMAAVALIMVGVTTGFIAIFGSKAFVEIINREGSVEAIIKALGIMALVGTELIAATAGIAAIGNITKLLDAKAIGKAVLTLIEVTGAIVLLVGAVAGIYALITKGFGASPEAVTEALNGAVEVFAAIGEAIGRLVGNIVGGALYETITYLGKAIASFFECVTNIDPSVANNLKILGEAMKEFAIAGLLSLVGGIDLVKTGKDLYDFIPYLNMIADETKDIDYSSLEGAISAAKGFGEFLNALPREGGLVGTILGDHEGLKEFSEGLPAFGDGIKELKKSLGNEPISEELVTSAINAGRAIAGLEKALPRRGGIQSFFGELETMKTFGENIAIFGKAITGYQKVILDETGGQGIDEELVTSSANAGQAIAKLENSLPKTGGVLQGFLGEVSMTKFANDMALFGAAIVKYSDAVSGKVNQGAVLASTIAGTMLSKLNNSLPATGGKLQSWLGEQNLGTFADGVASLGGALKSYSDNVVGVDVEASTAAIGVAESISAIAKSLGDNNVTSFFKGKSTLGDFGTQLYTFGAHIKAYGIAISGTNFDDVERSSVVVTKLADMAHALADVSSKGFDELQEGLAILAHTGLDTFANAFKDGDSETIIYNAGLGIATSLCAAINDSFDAPIHIEAKRIVNTFCVYFTDAAINRGVLAAKALLDIITNTLKHEGYIMDDAGRYILEGIERGIDRNWDTFKEYLIKKALLIRDAFQEGLEIESPSKVMRNEVGVFIVQGIAEGIEADTSAEDAAKKKAENIVNAFRDAFNRVSTILKGKELDLTTWGLQNRNATPMDKSIKSFGYLIDQLKSARENVELATAELKALEQSGRGSTTDEWKEANNELKQYTNTFLSLQNQVLDGFQAFVDPKYYTNELGEKFIQGIAYGISGDMTAEEIAAKKAENITKAFEKAMSSHDLADEAEEATYNLWVAQNPNATKAEKKAKEIAHLDSQIATSTERFYTATAKWRVTQASFEEGTKEYIEGQKEVQEAETALRNLINLRTETVNDAKEIDLIFNDAGSLIVQGIANGITSDMSAEEAVKQKLANITEAFNKGLERIEQNSSREDNELELWTAMNGNVSEALKTGKEIEANRRHMTEQAERIALAEAEYNAIVERSPEGANSKEAKDAMDRIIQERIKMAEYAAKEKDWKSHTVLWTEAMSALESYNKKQANELTGWFADSENNPLMKIIQPYLDAAEDFEVSIPSGKYDYGVPANTKLIDYLASLIGVTIDENIPQEVSDELSKLAGDKTLEDIVSNIRVTFGDDVASVITGASQTIVGAAAEVGEEAAEALAGSGLGLEYYQELAGQFINLNTGNLEGVGDSLTDLIGKVKDFDVGEVVTDVTDKAKGLLGQLPETVDNIGEKVIDKLTNTNTNVKNEGANFINEFLDGIKGKDGLDEKSPSKEMEEIGEYAIIGFANGLLEQIYRIKRASAEILDETISSMKGIVSRMDNVLQTNLDFTPTISPVLDLSDVKAAWKTAWEPFSGMIDTSGTYKMAISAFENGENKRWAKTEALVQNAMSELTKRVDGLSYSLDDLREVVETFAHNDLNLDINVNGSTFARATVHDFVLASRAEGTPFYVPSPK